MNPTVLLRALGHRNFRLYFLGQGVSLIGTWMQQVALAWLVFQMTGSPIWLGVVAFAGQIPTFFLAPVAGVLADRRNRHRLLLVTQTVMMVQAFLLAGLALTGAIALWQVLALSAILGVATAFDMTARQAFLTELIERRDDLANAIALNSSVVNGARLVGPALAGLLLAQTNPGICFLVNGVSYLAVLGALVAMHVPPRGREGPGRHPLHELREGFAYSFGFAPIRALLLLVALVSLLGSWYAVLLPVVATQTLHGGADTLGFLTAASGVGALASGILLASRRSVLGLGRWIAAAPAGLGVALLALASVHEFWLAALCLLAAGFALMTHLAASNTVLQTIVDEDKRGRVMSFYTMAFMGTAPLGSLLGGVLADAVGAGSAIALAGALLVAGACVFAVTLPALRERVRPIYRRLGILPEVAAGLQSAAQLTVPPEGR